MATSTIQLEAQESLQKSVPKDRKNRECVSSRYFRNCTYAVSLTWLPKQELNKDSNRYAKVNGGEREAQEASAMDKELQTTKEC